MPKPVQFSRSKRFGESDWEGIDSDPHADDIPKGPREPKTASTDWGGFTGADILTDKEMDRIAGAEKEELDVLSSYLKNKDVIKSGALDKGVDIVDEAGNMTTITLKQQIESDVARLTGEIESKLYDAGGIDTVEVQQLNKRVVEANQAIGNEIGGEELRLTTENISGIKSTSKNQPSIVNPQAMDTNIKIGPEKPYIKEILDESGNIIERVSTGINQPGLREPTNLDPLNRQSVNRKIDIDEKGFTGLEPVGYSPMNPTPGKGPQSTPYTGGEGDTWYKGLSGGGIKGPDKPKTGGPGSFVPPPDMNDDIRAAQDAADDAIWSDEHYPKRTDPEMDPRYITPDYKSQVPAAAQPTAKEIPSTELNMKNSQVYKDAVKQQTELNPKRSKATIDYLATQTYKKVMKNLPGKQQALIGLTAGVVTGLSRLIKKEEDK